MELKVSGIYVINLDSRPERLELFVSGQQNWEAVFGKSPVRLQAVSGVDLPGYGKRPWFTGRLSDKRKRSWAGKAGCILSHRQAIQLAAEQGWDQVLILEDDAFLADEMVRNWDRRVGQLLSRLPEDWAVINFCTTIAVQPCRTAGACDDTRLIEASGAFGAVAYLLNGKVLRQILQELPQEDSVWSWVARHKTIDRWFSRNLSRFGRVYLFAPAVVGHRTGSSDTSMTQENDWLLDFSLKDLKCVYSDRLFAFRLGLRKAGNKLISMLSLFRFVVKKFRGL